MNLYKQNCVYNHLKISIVKYLILGFITCNLYTIYAQFKITNIFKYARVTTKASNQAKSMLIWSLLSVVLLGVWVIGIYSWVLLDSNGYVDFATSYSGLVIYLPLIVFFFSNIILSITWAFKIRSIIREYNIAVYNVDYTANGFLTFFCPMIVFIWAIENTPNEASLKNFKV